jgi:hypothetical protein
MYLPTSNLNCSGNGETPDNTNIEISLIYNSTCPPGFKEISVNESVLKKKDEINEYTKKKKYKKRKSQKESVPVYPALYHGIFMLKSNVDTPIELNAIMCAN